MHHLVDVRDAGRFVLLARDSRPEANLWKDAGRNRTRVGGTVIIAEPHESSLMLSFDLTLATAA